MDGRDPSKTPCASTLVHRSGGIEVLLAARPDHPAYRQLLTTTATTGRCPVWVIGRGMESIHPHQEPELALADLDARVAEDVLRQRWPGRCGCPNDCMAPFDDRFPGLLPRPPVELTAAIEGAVAAASTLGVASDLAVVPVRRPADIPAATTAVHLESDDMLVRAGTASSPRRSVCRGLRRPFARYTRKVFGSPCPRRGPQPAGERPY